MWELKNLLSCSTCRSASRKLCCSPSASSSSGTTLDDYLTTGVTLSVRILTICRVPVKTKLVSASWDRIGVHAVRD
jgi:hypothetical protein